jgi:hypothetical protein
MYDLTLAQKREMREAMLSVYYHSLGRQWQQQGAPAVLLPPDIRPLGLAAALARLSGSELRLEDAIWRIIRSVPLPQNVVDKVTNRYPKVLLEYVSPEWLKRMDELRRFYRTGANMYAAALDLLAVGDVADAKRLVGMLEPRKGQNLNSAVGDVFGPLHTATRFDEMAVPAGNAVTRARGQLAVLEKRVGSTTRAFVMNYAEAVAFTDAGSPIAAQQRVQGDGEVGLDITPVSTVVMQDTATLSTTATVTTRVKGSFELVCRVVDPRSWSISSDVITHTDYIADAFRPGVRLTEPPAIGRGHEGNKLLHETAEISWGSNDDQQGAFDVVLNIGFAVADQIDRSSADAAPVVDLSFTLGRSISSSILWDRRPGGLRIDNGFIQVLPLAEPDSWLMTSRKTVKFTDRTPNLNRAGWADTGQLLNYLAPASLTWWIESEAFSMGSTAYGDELRHDIEARNDGEQATAT